MSTENKETVLTDKLEKKAGRPLSIQELDAASGGRWMSVPLEHVFVKGVCINCKITYGAYAASGFDIKCS